MIRWINFNQDEKQLMNILKLNHSEIEREYIKTAKALGLTGICDDRLRTIGSFAYYHKIRGNVTVAILYVHPEYFVEPILAYLKSHTRPEHPELRINLQPEQYELSAELKRLGAEFNKRMAVLL